MSALEIIELPEPPCPECGSEAVHGMCLNLRCPTHGGTFNDFLNQSLLPAYRLRGKRVERCHFIVGAILLEKANRHVAVECVGETTTVSTVFLGTLCGGPVPYLFETAVFDKYDDVTIFDRYITWAEAEEGHNRCVAELRKAQV